MSHLSCSSASLTTSPNIYYDSKTVTIIAKSGKDVPSRLDVSPWNSTCLSIPFNQITTLRIQILDCSYFNPTLLVNFTQLVNLDTEFINQPIPKSWFESNIKLQSLVLSVSSNIKTSFLTDLCSNTNYKFIKLLHLQGLSNLSIPQCIFSQGKKSLKSIQLTGMNNVTFDSMSARVTMYQLDTLKISDNKLTSFPSSLDAAYLKTFDGSNNLFQSLDDNVFPNVVNLHLSNNLLTEIPFWYYLGSDLNSYLDLSYNPIKLLVFNEIFVNTDIRFNGNSWIFNNAINDIDCTFPVKSITMDYINVTSINPIVPCSKNIRIRYSTIQDANNTKLSSVESIDMAFSSSYFRMMNAICMDSSPLPKMITVNKGIALPYNCTTIKDPVLGLKVDYPNCGYPNNLHNLTTGTRFLTCVDVEEIKQRQCLDFTPTTTSTKLKSLSSVFSTRRMSSSFTANKFNWVIESTSSVLSTVNKPFRWDIQTSIQINSTMVNTTKSWPTNRYNISSKLFNDTAFNNTNDNSSLTLTATKTDDIMRFRFDIIDESTTNSYSTKKTLFSTESISFEYTEMSAKVPITSAYTLSNHENIAFAGAKSSLALNL
eukprot:NODE_186_length_15678_cov_0.309262.p2 type:complete len:596 gc:universal NODE_186_length_15678_cov_0.309262:3873-2086(-)